MRAKFLSPLARDNVGVGVVVSVFPESVATDGLLVTALKARGASCDSSRGAGDSKGKLEAPSMGERIGEAGLDC